MGENQTSHCDTDRHGLAAHPFETRIGIGRAPIDDTQEPRLLPCEIVADLSTLCECFLLCSVLEPLAGVKLQESPTAGYDSGIISPPNQLQSKRKTLDQSGRAYELI